MKDFPTLSSALSSGLSDDPEGGTGAPTHEDSGSFAQPQPRTREFMDQSPAGPPLDVPGAPDDQLAAELERTGNHGGLIEHLLGQLDHAVDPRARTQILARVAVLFETRLADPQRAFVTLSSALTEAPDDEVLARLERLADGLGQRSELVAQADEAADELAESPGGEPAAARVKCAVARWARKAGELELSARAAERAATLMPGMGAALLEWQEALRGLQRWSELARVLTVQLRGLPPDGGGLDTARRAALHLDLAALWQDHLSDAEQAIAACQEVLRLVPGEPAALARITRLAEQQERWALLADTLEKRVPIAASSAERVDLLTRLAGLWEKLGRPDEAGRTWERVVELVPDHQTAFESLATLYRGGEHWRSLVATLERHAHAAADETRRTSLWFDAAVVTRDKLRRTGDAAALFGRVVEHDPRNVEALRGLVALHRLREQWKDLGELLVRLAEHTPDRDEKKSALLEAAGVHEKHLGDKHAGAELYGAVSELDPDDPEAALRRFDSHARDGDHANLLALGDWLLERGLPSQTQLGICERMVGAAVALADRDRGLALCERAGAMGGGSTELRTQWARLAAGQQQWPRAAELCRGLLALTELENQRRLELALTLGQASLALSDAAGAVRAFEHALTVDARHAGALEGLVQAHAARGDHESSLAARSRWFAATPDPRKKIDLARETARVCREVLGRTDRAVAALRQALDELPEAHELQHDLLDLYTSGKNWPAALAMLDRLVSAAGGALRAKYQIAAGNILCYELGNDEGAIERFNDALDANPGDLKAFEKIDKLLTKRQDWKAQERNYRRMIKRIESPDAPPAARAAELALWQGLGEIYRTRLGDLDAATVAFEVIKKLKRDDNDASHILAELYEHQGPEQYPRAIEEHRALLLRASTGQEMAQQLRALQRLYSHLRDFERAYSATSALVVLHEASQADRQYYRQYTSHAYLPPQGALSDDFWRRFLFHRDVDPRLAAIFASVSRAVALAHAKTSKEWGVNPRGKHGDPNVAAFEQIALRFVDHLSAVLGVAPPPVCARPDLAADLDLVPVGGGGKVDTVLVMGKPMLAPRAEKDYAFVIGRALARARAEHLVLWPNIVPSLSELRAIALAVLRLGGPVDVPAELGALTEGYARHLQQSIPPRELESLAALGRTLTPAELDLPRFIRGAVFSTNRAAFLACNDLESAARLIQSESLSTITVGRFEQIQDLIWWSVSEEFAAFRRRFSGGSS